jgi:hypothetical protein
MHRHLRLVIVAGALAAMTVVVSRALPVGRAAADTLPDRMTDQEFWNFTEQMSEPNGYFRSDNFLSNERGYQAVIPRLLGLKIPPNRVYLGVGPEQNFPYIIALHPKLAIIFDIRRGNLHEQLLYKALFEMSSDRADFLSRLWSRPRPAGLNDQSTVEALMNAYESVPASEDTYQANLRAVVDWLTVKHKFPLRTDDPDGIDYVYRTAFFNGGPGLSYQMNGLGGPGGGGRMMSTYADIQTIGDDEGINHGFLANETNWQAMKSIEARNMVVPVVGDFGGPTAIRAVAEYLKAHGAMVAAFYLSNVEQYLNQDGKEETFICNVAQLPLDRSSTFIFTGAGRYGRRGGGRGGFGFGFGGLNTTFLRPMLDDARTCIAPVARWWN